MNCKPSFSLLLTVVASLILGGCASAPETDHSSRYTLATDRAPSGNFDVSGLDDAVPVYEAPRRAGNKSPYKVWGKQYSVLDSNDGYVERGTASWYGEKFHGHKTSNGETFDMYAMSAAHKSLQIPGYARVTNLDNGRSVIVRVNDRGPFHGDRIIDLSYAAISVRPDGAMFIAGEPFSSGDSTGYSQNRVKASGEMAINGRSLFVQLGSFSSRDPAEKLLSQVRAVLENPMRVRAVDTSSGRFHRVQVGPFSDEDSARRTQSLLEARGFDQSILLTDMH